ncbi:MAG: hypothetical protein KI790_14505 [Cyclobacteriaceae bacterium]|nr:hypothetical protein [Cyclobacteriaceae bacterium HetDA_MAG_MS6]
MLIVAQQERHLILLVNAMSIGVPRRETYPPMKVPHTTNKRHVEPQRSKGDIASY